MPLYKIESPFSKASTSMSQAAGTFGRMQQGGKTTTKGPGKTIGGALMSGGSMGMTGYMMAGASTGGLTGPQGAAIGAMIGLGAYLLS